MGLIVIMKEVVQLCKIEVYHLKALLIFLIIFFLNL